MKTSLLTQTALAAKMNVSIPTVRNWIKEQSFPVVKNPGHNDAYSLTDVKKWIEKTGKTSRIEIALQLNEAKLKKLTAETNVIELKHETVKQQLVDIAAVNSIVASEYAIIRSHFRTAHNTLAKVCAHRDEEFISKKIRTAIDQILSELSSDVVKKL